MRYAVVGLVLIPAYRLSDRTLLILAAALIVSIPVLRLVTPALPHLSIEENPPEFCTELPEKYGGGGEVYAYGSFWEVRSRMVCKLPGEMRYWIVRLHALSILALFLFGLVIGRSGLYRRISESQELIWTVVFWTACIGFVLLALERPLVRSVHGPPPVTARLAREFILQAGRFLTSITYAGLLALLFQSARGRAVLMPLAAVGRMALTVYIGQSVIYSTLFSGYGMGWNQSMGRPGFLGLTLLIFSIEVVLCNLWLRYFHYGPLEWIWRCGTYMKWLPIRR